MLHDPWEPWYIHLIAWGIAVAPFVGVGLWLALR